MNEVYENQFALSYEAPVLSELGNLTQLTQYSVSVTAQ